MITDLLGLAREKLFKSKDSNGKFLPLSADILDCNNNKFPQKASSQDASSKNATDTDLVAVPTLFENINNAYTELISKDHAYADVVDKITKTMSCDFHIDKEDTLDENNPFSNIDENIDIAAEGNENVRIDNDECNRLAENNKLDIDTAKIEVDVAKTSSTCDDVMDHQSDDVIDSTSHNVEYVMPSSRKSPSKFKKFLMRLLPCVFKTSTV